MYEIYKLNEAKYFFKNMCNKIDDPVSFHHELSAFLSSARSVLQYGYEEAKTRSKGNIWYNKYVSQNSILNFFKTKRDINTHTEPVKTIKNITVCINEYIILSDSMNIGIQKEESSIKKKLKETNPQPEKKPNTMTVNYVFTDWQGKEDVIELCGKYIKKLDKFIKDGISKRFITEQLKK